jgi:AcrR family transcriptional regulator
MLDIMSSHDRDHRRELDTVSSAGRAGDPATRRRIFEAALRLIARRGAENVTMANVARAARVSRQALYLHFTDRADLLLAAVRYADERRGVAAAVEQVRDAPSGVAALRELAAMQARLNPGIWPLARAVDSVRHLDTAAERSWQDRLANRLAGCRALVARLHREGALNPDVEPAVATDLLWTLTSLRTWEDLVLLRSWTAAEYEERLTDLLRRALVRSGDAVA